MLAKPEQFVHWHIFMHWLGEMVTLRVPTLFKQGNLEGAAQLAESQEPRISRPMCTLHAARRIGRLRCLSRCNMRRKQRVGG